MVCIRLSAMMRVLKHVQRRSTLHHKRLVPRDVMPQRLSVINGFIRSDCPLNKTNFTKITIAASSDGQTFQVTPANLQAIQKAKVRLDTYVAQQLDTSSRARVSGSIKAGLVRVNGRVQKKPAYEVSIGDVITVQLLPPPTIQALPEDIPLDIVYEDKHLLVINKAAGMVVHPAPGSYSGTLVNALLSHCHLPAGQLLPHTPGAGPGSDGDRELRMEGSGEDDEDDDVSDDELGERGGMSWMPPGPVRQGDNVRPGIVHRLDKGTTGLLVVAKDEETLLGLSKQFKDRTVDRTYWSITCGCPAPPHDSVSTNIARDTKNRKRMTSTAFGAARGRTAVSGYRVLHPLPEGGRLAALVEWKLSTGRTHQIRVHAKHIGHPLVGDDTYGGGGAAITAAYRTDSRRTVAMVAEVERFGRPALHAKTLGFTHPITAQKCSFDSQLPDDFVKLQQFLARQ